VPSEHGVEEVVGSVDRTTIEVLYEKPLESMRSADEAVRVISGF
jgi:hypothetical protein